MSQNEFLVFDAIQRSALLYGNKDAYVDRSSRLTYEAYRDLCEGYAAGLLKKGVVAGDRIAVLSTNCNELMILFGAVAKIGAVLVPVNWRLKKEEIEYILSDCRPRYLFSSKEFCDLATSTSATIDSLQNRYVLDSDNDGGNYISLKRLFSNEKIQPKEYFTGDSELLIIYTAAVDGRPKGCLLTQSNLMSTGLQMSHLFKIDERDCHICILPLFHIGALSMMVATMLEGAKSVVLNRYDPDRTVQLIEKEKGTFFGTFPPILASFLDAQKEADCDQSSLRGVAGLDSPETIQRFLKNNPNATFFSLYGQTEAMPVCGGDYLVKPGSIGPATLLTRIKLCDDFDNEVPSGKVGEICVRSPSVFKGYWGLSGQTEDTFRNGWHHSGDLGRFDNEGFLWYEGRKPEKELIKSGGENVYPLEVEQAILSHSLVEETCVIGVPDQEWGEAVAAICVLKRGAVVSAQEICNFVSSKIAAYKKPKHVLFISDLPKKDTGRIDREQVKKTYRNL